MAYKPTKEHLSNEIPDAVKAIDVTLQKLRQQTGADDRYISLILSEMQRDIERNLKIKRFNSSFSSFS